MEVQDYLEQLSQATSAGAGFLLAYGLTWLIAAVAAWRLGERAGAYAALFQGMIGLPLGLLLTSLLSSAARPEHAVLNELSLYLAMGQLLVLPVAIVLVAQRRHTTAVAVLAVVLAVHFVPYAWLYSTPVYLVVAAVVAAGTAALVATQSRRSNTVAPVSATAGSVLLMAGTVLALT